MANNSGIYSAIGDTSKKIYDACDVLIDVFNQVRPADAQSIATLLCRGPKGAKYPYLVMMGPAPTMCAGATEAARGFFDRLKERFDSEDRFPEDDDEEGEDEHVM